MAVTEKKQRNVGGYVVQSSKNIGDFTAKNVVKLQQTAKQQGICNDCKELTKQSDETLQYNSRNCCDLSQVVLYFQ